MQIFKIYFFLWSQSFGVRDTLCSSLETCSYKTDLGLQTIVGMTWPETSETIYFCKTAYWIN
jgi:hypothetical protein